MAGAVRLNNGATVQVRVGVLQGVGPLGPRGLQGERGLQGDEGPAGPTGPVGGITNYMGQASIGTSNSLSINTDTIVSFSSLVCDDFSAYTATAWNLTAPGDYNISAWLDFSPAASASTGERAIWITAAGTTVARAQCTALNSTTKHTFLNIAWPIRIATATQVRILMRSGDTLPVAVSAGGVSVNRIGAGVQGVVGAQGPAGPVGPAGPQGIQGVAGNASSGFTRFDDLW